MNPETIRHKELALINELRIKERLPQKEPMYKHVYGTEVLDNIDPMKITRVSEERGFTYCNVGDGGSGAYYHPTGHAQVMYNFKGEPNFSIRKADPDYFRKAFQRAKQVREKLRKQKQVEDAQATSERQLMLFQQAKSQKDKAYLAFRNEHTDQYYVGYHDYENDTNHFRTVSGKDKAHDYLIQNGIEAPEIIETWRMEFKPDNATIFDPKNRFVNLYQPSKYMGMAQKVDDAEIPPHNSASDQTCPW